MQRQFVPLRLKCLLLFLVMNRFVFHAQTSTQNFGSSSSTYGSGTTGSSSYFANPTGSGTTYARTGNSPGGTISLNTTSNPLGSSGAYVRASASSGASVCKVSPIVGYTATKVFYAKFKMILGDASAGTSATDGEWKVFIGNGSMYNDNNDFTGSQVFTGLRFAFGSSGVLTLNNRNGSNWNTTGLNVSSFDQGTYYSVEIIGNNQSSGTISYTYNGVSQSVAINKQDVYINGVIIGDDIAAALLTNNTNVNSITFIGVSSTSNAANIFLDDVSMSNVIPSSLGGATDPTAFNLTSGNYTFNNWPSTSTIGTYPPNMIFHFADVNQTDPTLAQINATQDYVWGYNYTKSSRITGKGSNGFAFINTSPGHVSTTSGNLGEAVLALNTACRQNVQVSWRAGTTTTNTVAYKLRAQYRVGNTGSFIDLPNTGISQIEYTSPNAATNYGPITLPSSCDNVSLVQVRWVYYSPSSGSNPRNEINVTNISVTSSPFPSQYTVTGGGAYCSGSASPTIGLNNSQAGVNYQLYMAGATIGSPIAGTGSTISFGSQSAAGTYTVLGTDAVSSCTAVMSGSAMVSINPLPTVTAISNQTVCGGKIITISNFTSSPAGATFFWNNTNTGIGLAASGIGNVGTFTSSVVSSNQTGNISVTANLAGCFGPQVNFNVQVNGAQPATVWIGAVSSDWNDPDNWTSCVCGSSSDATITAVTSPSFNPVITSTAAVNNITLESASNLSVATTQTLEVYGNWVNNGTFTTQTGEVNFNGTFGQNISGASTTEFYNVALNNSNGASLSSPVKIKGTLQLNNGVFDTGNLLTLASSASSSGRIGPINNAADIINDVTVEQYTQPGYTGWVLMGSPITSSLTMTDWNDDFTITCLNCPNGFWYNFTSVYSYNESAVGTYSDAAKYTAITNITDPIGLGTGYWAYVGDSYPTTSAIVFDTKGAVAKSTCLSCGSPVELPLSYTNQGSITDDGWNLISNPLPSAISWTALRNNDPNVDDAIYAYNADANNGSGGFVSYVNGVASTTAGGINDTIPMCQGFYVHATGNATLTASESIKVNASPAFLKQSSSVLVKPMLRLQLNQGTINKDVTTCYFESNATQMFDKQYDAYKFIYDATQPYLCTIAGNRELDINGLPDPLQVNLSVPLKAIVPATATFTFSAMLQAFPQAVCAELYDSYTNITTNLLTSSYTCTLYDTTFTARFMLKFKTGVLNVNTNISQPLCSDMNAGKIIATPPGSAPWNYIWKDAANNIIKSTSLSMYPDSLTQLSGGVYKLWINANGTCNNYSQQFNINPVLLPVAQFTVNSDTLYLSNGDILNTTNLSQNAITYSWNFGDGGFDVSSNPSHTYTTQGTYTVSLISTSASFCSDTSSAQIVVINSPVGIRQNVNQNNILLINNDFNNYSLKFNLGSTERILIELTDMSGRRIDTKTLLLKDETILIPLDNYTSGVYYLNVNCLLSGKTFFKLIKS